MILTGKQIKPPRILLIGVEGIGKSDFGASAYLPVFIPTEDGIDELDVARFPKAEKYEDIIIYLDYLLDNEHDRKTVVVDSADWMERLIHKKIAAERNVKSIEDIGYQKGYTFSLDKFIPIKEKLERLRDEKGMAIIFTAHAKVKRYNSPEVEPYDRYQPKMHDLLTEYMSEWVDAVLFANYRVIINKTDVGFGKEVRRASGTGERVMYASERPAFRAKNRYGLPESMPFDKGESWNTLMTEIKNSRSI